MELNKDIFQKETDQDVNTKIDMMHRDIAMESIQKRKEYFEQMKKDFEQKQTETDQFHQQIKDEDMLRNINTDSEYDINEFGEIIRPNKQR